MSRVIDQLVEKYPDLSGCQQDVKRAFLAMKESYTAGGKLLVCGNGGSASDSEHIVGELMKGFMSKRTLPAAERQRFVDELGEEGGALADLLQGGLPAISLTSHAALISAVANDTDAAMVYAQQVYGYGKQGDVLLGLSTSGNSKNVLQALRVARVQGLTTIGLTGQSGGEMKSLCDICICVPYVQTPDVQERHLPIYHALCLALEEALFQP
ncbi:D-sedoheptulose-7-phosphate isomerase [Alicyclobacillus fodiniaquatilis]|uniref:SIS domain-containing protein n=1 Tax=Alicyclobacillus fodiniaquatilis TaxID=1661150 RepID=A0ABW4JJY5_9BACL